MNTVSELDTGELKGFCDGGQLEFDSTEELTELDEVIGQDRAVSAVTFGIDIDSPCYNIFAMGTRGTGKKDVIKQFLEREAEDQDVPGDWVYVKNFDRPDQPRAIKFQPERGAEFRDDMDQLVDQLRSDIPDAFEGDDYKQEREQIQEEFSRRRQELMKKLEEEAEEYNFTILQTPQGIMLAPVVDGEPMTPDEFSELEEDRREEIEDQRETLQQSLQETMEEIRSLQHEMKDQVHELDQRVISFIVEDLIDELKEKYGDVEGAVEHLDEVHDDLLDNVDMFKQMKDDGPQQGMPFFMAGPQGPDKPDFDQYRANLMVDNSDQEGAPVVFESNPTYYNLLGRIEHKGEFGALTTDFTMVKNGALHEANGGYLMVEAKDLLSKPFAWEAIKRALNNDEIKTETMGQEYRAVQTQTLEPETIPLDVKVVLLGNPYIYYLLYELDEDFQELFKVKADFSRETDRGDEIVKKYARYIGTLSEDEELSHFSQSGVCRVVEEASRMVSDQDKLSAELNHIGDLVRESNYWSDQNGNNLVTDTDVQKAVDEMVYRSNRMEERIQELIDEGTILIDTDEDVVGQLNGISVLPVGDYQFGKPSRITARTHVGSEGVINIEREADLGGRIHNKGVMILSGYLGGQFAQDMPLALSASLTFEQTYSEVDGDSASSAELYALLSSLSGYSLRQDLAVTGSVNQRGQVQSIGGVNDKIEGFFRVCEQDGLTGDQGVIIPESNVKNLMLREEVIEAVEQGEFHIYPVETIDQGIELLTGKQAGERNEDGNYPEDTVKWAVQRQLKEYAETEQEFIEVSGDKETQ
ncbi:MAG: Lon protease family protein [bacterium]